MRDLKVEIMTRAEELSYKYEHDYNNMTEKEIHECYSNFLEKCVKGNKKYYYIGFVEATKYYIGHGKIRYEEIEKLRKVYGTDGFTFEDKIEYEKFVDGLLMVNLKYTGQKNYEK